ncbi:MAG: helix-turn-helix domain-containing protein [Ignavibacteria bacterium]|nr:helix-turn-helix domain-containing protein [Ignavibacteria bacterium]
MNNSTNEQNTDNPTTTVVTSDYKLMSVNEVRKLLNVSPNSVMKLILSGQLHAVKISKRYKIPLLSVKNYIETISNYDKLSSEESIVPRYNTLNQHDVESVLDRMYKKYSTN